MPARRAALALAAALLVPAGLAAEEPGGDRSRIQDIQHNDKWLSFKIRSAESWASGSREELLDGRAWRRFSERIGKAGALLEVPQAPRSDLDRSEGYRYLSMLLRNALDNAIESYDPDRPRIFWNDRLNKVGLDCADALYGSAPLRDSAVYRIRGRRGTVRFLGFQLMAGQRTLHNTHAGELEIAKDGSFELVIGGERRPGNWMPLPPGSDTLTLRQFFYDWEHETPASLAIERIDAGPRSIPARNDDPERLAKLLDAVATNVEANLTLWPNLSAARREGGANRFPTDPEIGGTSIGGQAHQASGIGYFSLEPDEVLLVEVRPPNAYYWSFHLGNYWMESLDYANYKSSINGHQARLDGDGMFRAVIAARDPGVPNWLDTAGHREGTMIYRWNLADGAPIPATRIVKQSELAAILPKETPHVSAAERAAEIESRRRGVVNRMARPL